MLADLVALPVTVLALPVTLPVLFPVLFRVAEVASLPVDWAELSPVVAAAESVAFESSVADAVADAVAALSVAVGCAVSEADAMEHY
jgi:hypothetical protein